MTTSTTNVGLGHVDTSYGHEQGGTQPAAPQRARSSSPDRGNALGALGGLGNYAASAATNALAGAAQRAGPRLLAELPAMAQRFQHSRYTQRMATFGFTAMFPELAAARGLGGAIFGALSLAQKLAVPMLNSMFGRPAFAANMRPTGNLGAQFFRPSFFRPPTATPMGYGAPFRPPMGKPPGASPYGPSSAFANASMPAAAAPVPPRPRPQATPAGAGLGANSKPSNPTAGQNARPTANGASAPPPRPQPTATPGAPPPPPRFGNRPAGGTWRPQAPANAWANSMDGGVPQKPPKKPASPPQSEPWTFMDGGVPQMPNGRPVPPKTTPEPWTFMDGGVPQMPNGRPVPPKATPEPWTFMDGGVPGTQSEKPTRPQTPPKPAQSSSTKPAAAPPNSAPTGADMVARLSKLPEGVAWHEVLGVDKHADLKTIEEQFKKMGDAMKPLDGPRNDDVKVAMSRLGDAHTSGKRSFVEAEVGRLGGLTKKFDEVGTKVFADPANANLSMAAKQKIEDKAKLELFREALGVPENATKKEIRTAYLGKNQLVSSFVQNNGNTENTTPQDIQKLMNSARDALNKEADKNEAAKKNQAA